MKSNILNNNVIQKFKEEQKKILFNILIFVVVTLLILISGQKMNRLNSDLQACVNVQPIRDTLFLRDTIRDTIFLPIFNTPHKTIYKYKIDSVELTKLNDEINILKATKRVDSININKLFNSVAFFSDIPPNCIESLRYFEELKIFNNIRMEYRK